MHNNSPWMLPAYLAIGVAVFGLAYTAMKPGNENSEPTTPQTFKTLGSLSTSPTVNEIQQAPAPAVPPVEKPKSEEKPKAAEKPKPAAPAFVSVRERSWSFPVKAKDGHFRHDDDLDELAINEKGTRVLTKSRREVFCFDLTTGQILQTFSPKADPKGGRTSTESILLFEDAGFVATLERGSPRGKSTFEELSIKVQAADTGRVVGTFQRPKNSSVNAHTSFGSQLLVFQSHPEGLLCQTISGREGSERKAIVPNVKYMDRSFTQVLPVPNKEVAIAYRQSNRPASNPSGMVSLDLKTGVEKPITSIDKKPDDTSLNKGMAVSRDGKLVLMQENEEIQISDWQSNRRIFKSTVQPGYIFKNPTFTPDGKRFLVQRASRFKVFRVGEDGRAIVPPASIELYDIASAKNIASYELDKEANTFAISGDGKTIVHCHGTTLMAIDFRTSFEIDPLPPVK